MTCPACHDSSPPSGICATCRGAGEICEVCSAPLTDAEQDADRGKCNGCLGDEATDAARDHEFHEGHECSAPAAPKH